MKEDIDNLDEEQEEDPANQSKSSKPWLFQPGKSGNPSGKPKGTISLKTWAKKMIQEMTDEEKLEFLKGLPKQIIWQMAEGMAAQGIKGEFEITTLNADLTDEQFERLIRQRAEELNSGQSV